MEEELFNLLNKKLKFTIKYKDNLEGYLQSVIYIQTIKKRIHQKSYNEELLLNDLEFLTTKNKSIIKKISIIRYNRIKKNRNKIFYFFYIIKRKYFGK